MRIKALMGILFLMAVGSNALAQEMGKVVLRDEEHFMFLPLGVDQYGRNCLPGRFINQRGCWWASGFEWATWNSERSHWEWDSGSRSTARMVVDLEGKKYLVFNLGRTFDADRGVWILWNPQERHFFYMNLSQLESSGKKHRMVGDELEYGDYVRPTLTVSAGTMTLNFHTNGVIGFNQFIYSGKLAFIRWESDAEGWGGDSDKVCIPEEVSGTNRLRCVIQGLKAGDHGDLYAVMRDGSKVRFMPRPQWRFGSNIEVLEDLTMRYW